MLSTAYALPFVFELPPDNPWDGRRAAELVVHAAHPLSAEQGQRLGMIAQSFWFLAAAGGLSGTKVAPWLSSFRTPRLYAYGHGVRFVFSPSVLDERATSCLLMLLLSAHEEVPLQGARLSVPGSPIGVIGFQSSMGDPYPELWSPLPFAVDFDEESESETRELRIQFEASLSDEQVMRAQDMLWSWGKASEWGAFALPPLPPRSSSCLASDPVEHYEGELTWPVTKCRFHRSALDSLVAVCAAMHHRVARIREAALE